MLRALAAEVLPWVIQRILLLPFVISVVLLGVIDRKTPDGTIIIGVALLVLVSPSNWSARKELGHRGQQRVLPVGS
jgi:hypothetical protein